LRLWVELIGKKEKKAEKQTSREVEVIAENGK